ncbi:MAG: bifunctional methylenetetrahydrofolate dehydrogenase/methenyltetrahydrofolate cyclohydrolase [Betaproteobacteria bacterium]|nr:bifunctional methylenetetrahydrofolate dehydrogenase/methenyltetrahydrofolate cyclohydrolase [Betaproteobacteria bacterium]
MSHAIILDGTSLAAQQREALRPRIAALQGHGVRPRLDVIVAGDDPASAVYVRTKMRTAGEIGVESAVHRLSDTTSEEELLQRIAPLNADPLIHGILVQLPLPDHIASHHAIAAIAPEKDVDGFHPQNVGALVSGRPTIIPCTPAGIMVMLESGKVPLWGKHAVVVGTSNIVGKPVAMLLLQQGATVTLCNSKTPDLAAMTRQGDILIVAVGRPGLITGAMVKPGAAVIDVGISRLSNGKLSGDVDFDGACQVAGWISPVPGGVGPMTVAMLIANTVLAAERMQAPK